MINGMRRLAPCLALIASIGVASAQQAPGTLVAPSQGLNTGTSVAPTIDPKAGLRLTEDQRGMILKTVHAEKSKVKTPPADVQATVGADLPPSLELYHLPDAVVSEVPNAKLYKYTMVRDDVLLVDPTRMKVVDVIR